MPVVGIISPSEKEYEAHVDGRLPEWYTPEELLAKALHKGPGWSPYTYELLYVMLADFLQERSSDRVSVTMMLGCPRSTVIERREPYIERVDNLYAAVRGTLVHKVLEQAARPGAIPETHFLTELDGLQLSCIIDIITPEGDLYDYKVSDSVPPGSYPYRNQTLQLMYNAYIARHAKRMKNYQTGEEWHGADITIPDIRSVSIEYIGPKWPKILTIKKKQPFVTPKGKTIERRQPYVWTDEEVLEGQKRGEPGLQERVEAMRLALDSYPDFPPELCDIWGGRPEDGWRCPGKPWCGLPDCTAKRYPNGLVWDKPDWGDDE